MGGQTYPDSCNIRSDCSDFFGRRKASQMGGRFVCLTSCACNSHGFVFWQKSCSRTASGIFCFAFFFRISKFKNKRQTVQMDVHRGFNIVNVNGMGRIFLSLVALLKKDFKEVKNLIPFWILSILLFVLYLFYVKLLTGSFAGGGLFEALLQRSGVGEEGQIANLNIFTYLNQMRLWYVTLFTLTLCLLSGLWFMFKLITRKISDSDFKILTLGIFGITYPLIFINSSYIHNYLIFYMLPFIALASASMFNILVIRFKVKNYRWLFFTSIILIVFLERFEFTKALILSEPDKFSVEVGRFINRETKPDETVTIQADPIFWETSENFLKYYGGRRLVFSQDAKDGVVVQVDNEKQTYKLIKE